MIKEPFLSALPVLHKLEEAGFEAYFVGGSVRDYLLNKQISDVDIATSAMPYEVKSIFPKTVDVGIEHGTVLVLYQGKNYEVTTFRTEGEYKDFRRPKEVSFIRNLEEDLKRRDFTMNAIAMDQHGQLIDPFLGQRAIKDKVIRTVGEAKDRFTEDALRMMRAVRFVSQLSFEIEAKTLTALTELAPLLDHIAVERKRTEFEKLFTGRSRKNAMQLLVETEVFSYLPGLRDCKQPLEKIIVLECEGLNKLEMWTLLLYTIKQNGKVIDSFLRAWRLPGREIKEIHHLLSFLEKRLDQKWEIYDLYAAGFAAIQSVERLYAVIKGLKDPEAVEYWLNQYENLPIKQHSELDVTGNDLINWFQKSGGPWIKETLLKIEKAILDREIANKKREIKEWLIACSQK